MNFFRLFGRGLTIGLTVMFTLTPTLAAGGGLSQTFQTKVQFPIGTVVSLSKDNAKGAILADSNNVQALLGTVVGQKDSLIILSDGQNNTQVATSGVFSVRVSNINGDIAIGDKITASPLSGIGMKATFSTKILGVAQASLSSQNKDAKTQTIQDKSSNSTTVIVGQVPVFINITDYIVKDTSASSQVVEGIQSVASNIGGKPVSATRAIIAALILLLAVVLSAVIVYSSVANAIRSIGRNPLSRSSIRRTLLQVVLVVVAIMIAAFSAIFLILRQ